MAKKLESSLKNMALSLFVICGAMSAALGVVYSFTKGPIENAEKQKINNAIKLVVPEFDNDPGAESFNVGDLIFYPAKKGGQMVGTAVKSYTNNGFGGYISVMVGLKPNGTIFNTAVMSQKETPGLGTKMTDPKFKNQFNDKHPDQFRIKVKKDGGDVDAITAATISSRAFCDAINRAVDAYKNNELNNASQQKGGVQ